MTDDFATDRRRYRAERVRSTNVGRVVRRSVAARAAAQAREERRRKEKALTERPTSARDGKPRRSLASVRREGPDRSPNSLS